MTHSTQNATSPKSTKSRNSDSSVSCGTNSNWDFGWIWICTEKLEFFDLLDSGVWKFQWNLSCKDHSLQIRGRSFSAKEPLMIGLFCVKWPMTTRHPMHLRHPVQSIAFGVSINLNLQSQSHWSPFSHFFNLKSQSMIEFSRSLSPQNLAKETLRTQSSIEIWDLRNGTPNAIGCMYMYTFMNVICIHWWM